MEGENESAPPEHVKVVFDLAGHEHVASESLWARPLPDGTFELDNVPFFVRAIACGDVVETEQRDGCHWFVRVARLSGNSTVRFFFDDAGLDLTEAMRPFRELGCGWEGGQGGVRGAQSAAVHVPAAVDFAKVYTLVNTLLDEHGAEGDYGCLDAVHREQLAKAEAELE